MWIGWNLFQGLATAWIVKSHGAPVSVTLTISFASISLTKTDSIDVTFRTTESIAACTSFLPTATGTLNVILFCAFRIGYENTTYPSGFFKSRRLLLTVALQISFRSDSLWVNSSPLLSAGTIRKRLLRRLESLTERGVNCFFTLAYPSNQRCWFHASHQSEHGAGITFRLSTYEAL